MPYFQILLFLTSVIFPFYFCDFFFFLLSAKRYANLRRVRCIMC